MTATSIDARCPKAVDIEAWMPQSIDLNSNTEIWHLLRCYLEDRWDSCKVMHHHIRVLIQHMRI